MPIFEVTNMCMIRNPVTNQVVVQERVKSWKGLTFPGGHLEMGESLVNSAIREVREETGLCVSNLKSCGIIHYARTDVDEHYFVHLYKTESFSGMLLSATTEGSVCWMDVDALFAQPSDRLPPNFRAYLDLFFDQQISEAYMPWSKVEKDMGEIFTFQYFNV